MSDHNRDYDRATSKLVGDSSIKASPAGRNCGAQSDSERAPQTDHHAATGQREHFFQERKMIAPFGIQ